MERLAKEARREAVIMGCDTLIVDTAGRLHMDQELMAEMERLKKLLNPAEILFVADAMTGQDAVNSAQDFHTRLGLTGVVLTKMDGDARGGAALSIRHVTGQPIKFLGVGEKPDAFEPFHPDRIVGRILGMGDMMSLIEKAESTLDRKKKRGVGQEGAAGRRVYAGRFPRPVAADQKDGIDGVDPEDAAVGGSVRRDAAGLKENGREAVCAAGGDYQLHDADGAAKSRDHLRLAAQADCRGVRNDVQDVNQLLRQYAQMAKMFKQMGKGGLARNMMRGGLGSMGMGGKQRFGR